MADEMRRRFDTFKKYHVATNDPHRDEHLSARTNVARLADPRDMYAFLWNAPLSDGARKVWEFLQEHPEWERKHPETCDVFETFHSFSSHEACFNNDTFFYPHRVNQRMALSRCRGGTERSRMVAATAWLLQKHPGAMFSDERARMWLSVYGRHYFPPGETVSVMGEETTLMTVFRFMVATVATIVSSFQ